MKTAIYKLILDDVGDNPMLQQHNGKEVHIVDYNFLKGKFTVKTSDGYVLNDIFPNEVIAVRL